MQRTSSRTLTLAAILGLVLVSVSSTALAQYTDESGRDMLLQPDAESVSTAITPIRPAFPDPLLYAGGTVTFAMLICSAMLMLPRVIRGR